MHWLLMACGGVIGGVISTVVIVGFFASRRRRYEAARALEIMKASAGIGGQRVGE